MSLVIKLKKSVHDTAVEEAKRLMGAFNTELRAAAAAFAVAQHNTQHIATEKPQAKRAKEEEKVTLVFSCFVFLLRELSFFSSSSSFSFFTFSFSFLSSHRLFQAKRSP